MTGKQAKELIIKNASPYFESKGWKLKKLRRNEALFLKEETDFCDSIGISTTDYYPEQLVGFGIGKRIESVESIMNEMDKKFSFKPPLNKDLTSLNLMDEHKQGTRKNMPYSTTENDIIKSLKVIFSYLDNHALPTLEKFNDLREVDKRINGVGENYWDTDWKKPFNLAGYFYYRRLIIARLSGRKDYDDFIEGFLTNIEKACEAENMPFDRNDLSEQVVYCIHLLKNVEPLY